MVLIDIFLTIYLVVALVVMAIIAFAYWGAQQPGSKDPDFVYLMDHTTEVLGLKSVYGTITLCGLLWVYLLRVKRRK